MGNFYHDVLSEEERTCLVGNIAGHIKDAAEFIQERAVKNFSQYDPEYGGRIAELLKQYKAVRYCLFWQIIQCIPSPWLLPLAYRSCKPSPVGALIMLQNWFKPMASLPGIADKFFYACILA